MYTLPSVIAVNVGESEENGWQRSGLCAGHVSPDGCVGDGTLA